MLDIKAWRATYRNKKTEEVITSVICSETMREATMKARAEGFPQNCNGEWWELVNIEEVQEPESSYTVKKRMILKLIPEEPTGCKEIWQDGNEILSKNEEVVERMADMLEVMGFDEVSTGYYDPADDAASDEVDDHTGYYYVLF